MKKLPNGWSKTSLSEIAQLNMGQSPDGNFTNNSGNGLPLIGGAADFKDGKIKFTRYTSKPTKTSEVGDLILCIRATIGKVAFSDQIYCLGRGVAGIKSFVDSKWLYYKLMDSASELDKAGTGTTFRQIDKKTLEEWSIYLAPLAEQKRIVDKIETIIARLKHASDHLNTVAQLVEEYKRAVLKAAFSGELTSNWRKINSHVGARDDQDIPFNWKKLQLGEISIIQTGLALGKKRKSSEITYKKPYLRVANVQRGYLELSEVKYVEVTSAEFEKLHLKKGDILMNEGGDRDKLGRGWIWSGQIEDCIHQNHVFRVRLKDKAFPPKWISYYANEFGQQYFIDGGQQTTNLASISKAKVFALPIPIPPVDEANEIVRRLEEVFARIDHVASEAKNAAHLTAVLYKAALAKAFSGDLVPQDSSDEPASDFLTRIQAEKQGIKKVTVKFQNMDIGNDIIMSKTLTNVLTEAQDWLNSQDAFLLCGISQSASTEEIEVIYSELRELDQKGLLLVESVRDENDKKLYDRIKLNKQVNYAS